MLARPCAARESKPASGARASAFGITQTRAPDGRARVGSARTRGSWGPRANGDRGCPARGAGFGGGPVRDRRRKARGGRAFRRWIWWWCVRLLLEPGDAMCISRARMSVGRGRSAERGVEVGPGFGPCLVRAHEGLGPRKLLSLTYESSCD